MTRADPSAGFTTPSGRSVIINKSGSNQRYE